jgi:hypothetical protein
VELLGRRTGAVREQPTTVPGMTAADEPPVVEATLAQLTGRARALGAKGRAAHPWHHLSAGSREVDTVCGHYAVSRFPVSPYLLKRSTS